VVEDRLLKGFDAGLGVVRSLLRDSDSFTSPNLYGSFLFLSPHPLFVF